MPALLDPKSLGGEQVMFKWNAGEVDDKWEQGRVWKKGPSRAEQLATPTANTVVTFGFGAVPVELSRETYGKGMKWVLLSRMGAKHGR